MNLKNISNYELTQRLEKLVRTERKITHLVLLHIVEIEERKLYAEMGFDGMYTYLTRGLGYSEASAYRRLQAARLLKQVPSVAEKIESGALNLSQLTQVQKCLKEEAKIGVKASTQRTEEILENLQHKNAFETQKTLAVEFNQPVQKIENLRPQADDSVRIEVTLTAEQFQELEQAKNLLSHICPDGSWADVIATLAKNYNQKKLGKNVNSDNVCTKTRNVLLAGKELNINSLTEKILNANSPAEESLNTDPSTGKCLNTNLSIEENLNKNSPAEEYLNTNPPAKTTHPVLAKKLSGRKYISIHTKRDLLIKGNHCCEFVNPETQKKCQSKFYLEIDHIYPLALGGSNSTENLRVLCRTHNSLAARKYGMSFAKNMSLQT